MNIDARGIKESSTVSRNWKNFCRAEPAGPRIKASRVSSSFFLPPPPFLSFLQIGKRRRRVSLARRRMTTVIVRILINYRNGPLTDDFFFSRVTSGLISFLAYFSLGKRVPIFRRTDEKFLISWLYFGSSLKYQILLDESRLFSIEITISINKFMLLTSYIGCYNRTDSIR